MLPDSTQQSHSIHQPDSIQQTVQQSVAEVSAQLPTHDRASIPQMQIGFEMLLIIVPLVLRVGLSCWQNYQRDRLTQPTASQGLRHNLQSLLRLKSAANWQSQQDSLERAWQLSLEDCDRLKQQRASLEKIWLKK